VSESTEYLFADDVYEDAEIKGYRDGTQTPIHPGNASRFAVVPGLL
jgi:hypothetical protein